MWSYRSKILGLLAVVASQTVTLSTAEEIKPRPGYCPCKESKNCNLARRTSSSKPEVYAFSNGATNVHMWKWKSFGTLMVPSSFDSSRPSEINTMCLAHSMGKRFGISVDMSLEGALNSSSKEADEWVQSTLNRRKIWHADVVNVDLLPYFLNDVHSTKADHIALVKILKKLKTEMDEVGQSELTCVVPWKPPCANAESSCDFSWISVDACDYFIINPDSFTDQHDVKCRARATIPQSKLAYGISEYNSHDVPLNRLILGVPWHGYDYVCTESKTNICHLPQISVENQTSTKCDLSKRTRITYGDIIIKHKDKLENPTTDALYMAPYFNYKMGTTGHQVWYEDHDSLRRKYKMAHELQMRGVALLYGDDLSSTMSPNVITNQGRMWSWVAHEFLFSQTSHPVHHDLSVADTVAGVAVGCLVLGVFIGIIFTWLTLRRRVKKPQRPFHVDEDGTEDYHDDDPTL